MKIMGESCHFERGIRVKVEIITKQFHSNCLVEALKAKILHPLTVKITLVTRSEAGCPHFLWSDGRYDYDFGTENHLNGCEKFWFNGCIRRRKLGFNEKYKKRMKDRQSRQKGNPGDK